MTFNTKGVIYLVLFALILSVAIFYFAPRADAEEASTVTVSYPGASPLIPVYRISQGDDVFVNDTVDISGVSGWRGPDGEWRLAYYGPWMTSTSPEDVDPEYILTLPGRTHSESFSSQYRYYIDPEIFGNRPGYWYQWTSNASRMNRFESAGNLRAFYVNATRRQMLTTGNNTTAIFLPGDVSKPSVKPLPLLPERHISDYVLAKGDSFNVGKANISLWLFGRKDGIYSDPDGYLTVENVTSLENGDYKVLIQRAGPNTIYDVRYIDNGVNQSLIPGLYGRQKIDVTGMAAPVVLDKVGSMLEDDKIELYKMELSDPFISIDRADEVDYLGRTFLDVRGYSNVANSTDITVILDDGKTYKRYIGDRTVIVKAIRTSPGNLSYYQALVPYDYDNLVAANAMNHTLTAKTAIGGVVYHDFWISVMPPDSCQYQVNGVCKTNASLKYTLDRNPFVPTPTPEVIVHNIPGPKETVVVVETREIPPDVNDYAKLAEGLTFWIGTWIIIGILSLIGLATLVYLGYVWWRGRND